MSKPTDPTSTALATVAEHSSAIAAPGDFGPEHMRIVREAFAPTASQAEFEVMWAGAKARRLDPVRKQIHFVKRYDNMREADVWSSQVSIDGFRSIAEDTGKYDGQDEPEYEYNGRNELLLARVRVYRKDIARAFVGVARWSEYVQTKRGGEPTHMWKKMAHTMLSKCAEALALRKAFPEQLSGLYTGEEMMQADSEGNVSAPRPVEARPVIEAEPERTLPANPPARISVSADVLRERARWAKDGGDENTERVLAGSPDPNDRALVFEWRIAEARRLEDLAALARIATDITADPHEEMRGHMLQLAEKKRAEMTGGGGA